MACFASSSERQKRQRHFKTILLHTEVVYFPRIFPLYLPLAHLDKLYGKCTDLYAHAQTVDTRRSSQIFQAPGYEATPLPSQAQEWYACNGYLIVVYLVSHSSVCSQHGSGRLGAAVCS